MSDTHMSRKAVKSVRLGRGNPAGPGWLARACDGAKQEVLGESVWCDYDLVITRLLEGAPVPSPEPGQLPTCPGCAVKLDAAMEASQ